MLLYQTAYNSKSSERAWAQLELTNENSRIHLITPIYHLPHADGIHLTNVGYARQGFHEGRAHAELLAGKRPQWIKPLSIKVQGTTALLSYHVPTPPLVLDRHTLAPTTNDGYHAYDSNGELVILAREITGNGTIVRLTFNRTPKGLLTVTYAHKYLGVGLNIKNGASGNLRDSTPDISIINNVRYPEYYVAPHHKFTLHL